MKHKVSDLNLSICQPGFVFRWGSRRDDWNGKRTGEGSEHLKVKKKRNRISRKGGSMDEI
jgi:hypothetical protein